MSPITKSRGAKTTRQQYELYINELETNIPFRENKFDAADPDIINRTWENLSAKLNSCGGPVKDVAGWKRTICDWKCQVRGRARKLRVAKTETGNKGDPVKPLNDIEERLLAVTGSPSVDGFSGIPEIGTEESIVEPTVASLATPVTQPVVPEPQTVTIKIQGSSANNAKRVNSHRKPRSLVGCLQSILTQPTTSDSSDTGLVNVLTSIDNNLSKIVRLKNKKLKLQQLQLQVKYPEYHFHLSSDESDA